MTTVWHLLPARDIPAERDALIAPASLRTEGFVHCSPDEATTLAVANTLYRGAVGPMAAIILDVDRLSSEVRFEAAAPKPPDGVAADTLFPHVYGPLDCAAIVETRHATRDSAGRYLVFTTR